MSKVVRQVSWMGVTQEVRIKNRNNRLWRWWLWFFPGADLGRVYIALGRTIWCPEYADYLKEDMFVHELEHLKQQRFSYLRAFVTFWRFWLSKKYRLETELPAFQAQYQYMQGRIPIKELYQYRHAVADVLSGPLYGEIITKAEAFERLGEKAV